MSPLQPQVGEHLRRPVVVPVAVNRPVAVPAFLMAPPIQLPVRDLVTLVQPQPELLVPTQKMTNPLLPTTAIAKPVVPSSTATSTRPVDRSATLGLETPALPVSSGARPLLYQTTEIIERLPTATSLTLAPKMSSSQAPLAPADVFAAPALPGGITAIPLMPEVSDQTVVTRTDSYRDPPALPAD
jgi:hypothetical protein